MANELKQGTAVFPAGMVLRLEDNGAVVGNQGDVVIEGDISKSLGTIKRVFSEQGSVEISAPSFKADQIEAASGEVLLRGTVKARKITGGAVRSTGGKLTSQVIIAEREVELTGKSIKVELVVAPKVGFGSDTKGRATAVECDNEIGASKVRGRLSLVDYVEIVAGAKQTLEENGIPIPESDDDEEDDEDESFGGGTDPPGAEPEDPAAPDDLSGEFEPEDLPAPDAADPPSEEAEASGGDIGLTGKDLEEFVGMLTKALDKIEDAYTESEVPPPVVFLESLVSEGRYEYIRAQINSIWSDLLKYHQKKGLYISNAVTHQFQQIQMAMRRLPDG